jgi:hypothetical protein
MHDSGSASSGHARLRRLGRWSFRFLLGVSVLWGMFSAVVMFAVRYDLLPDDNPTADQALRPLSIDEARDWPIVSAADWRHVITPDSAMSVAHDAPQVSNRDGKEAAFRGGRIERMDLQWSPAYGTAAWIAHIAQPACDCPFESVDRWDYARIVIDPLTGESLGRSLRAAITTGEMEAQYGVRH